MDATKRFEDAEWYTEMRGSPVMIGGLGAIGSWIALFLARIGVEITAFDPDVVEEHNLGGQLYFRSSIGHNKAEAVREVLHRLCDFLHMNSISARFERNSMGCNICVAAFDNMKSRKDMFENWLEYMQYSSSEQGIFIDGRLLMESFEIFMVDFTNKEHIERYKNYLFDDIEVKEEPCSAKATSHCGAAIAAFITGGITNWITNTMVYQSPVREVPFRTLLDMALFNLTTE